MITSTKNEQVKHAAELLKKAKTRNEEGLFVAEGTRLCQEIPKERVERLFLSESFLKGSDGSRFLKQFEGCRTEEVSDSVFASMADTRTPQGVLAIVRQYAYTFDDMFPRGGAAHLMILESLQDPGNLGTIVRAGEGAGITGVIMSRDTVDIYNPKVIRSTMGSALRVPFLYTEDILEACAEMKKRGVRLYAAHLKGRNNYEQEDYTGNTGFLIGNEGNGLSDALSQTADAWVKIPMAGKVESLHAAVAASVLMFEAARQRRLSTDKGVSV